MTARGSGGKRRGVGRGAPAGDPGGVAPPLRSTRRVRPRRLALACPWRPAASNRRARFATARRRHTPFPTARCGVDGLARCARVPSGARAPRLGSRRRARSSAAPPSSRLTPRASASGLSRRPVCRARREPRWNISDEPEPWETGSSAARGIHCYFARARHGRGRVGSGGSSRSASRASGGCPRVAQLALRDPSRRSAQGADDPERHQRHRAPGEAPRRPRSFGIGQDQSDDRPRRQAQARRRWTTKGPRAKARHGRSRRRRHLRRRTLPRGPSPRQRARPPQLHRTRSEILQ